MEPVIRNAARAAAVSLILGLALVVPASAQRVQESTPLPAPVASAPAVEPASTPAAAPAAESGPRIRAEFRRADVAPEPVRRKDSMNTITISTLALVLAVVVLVLLIK